MHFCERAMAIALFIRSVAIMNMTMRLVPMPCDGWSTLQQKWQNCAECETCILRQRKDDSDIRPLKREPETSIGLASGRDAIARKTMRVAGQERWRFGMDSRCTSIAVSIAMDTI